MENVQAKCVECGGLEFEHNDDLSYIKCVTCEREYLEGKDELMKLNAELYASELALKSVKDVFGDMIE